MNAAWLRRGSGVRLNRRDSKSRVPLWHRGFKSLPLRHPIGHRSDCKTGTGALLARQHRVLRQHVDGGSRAFTKEVDRRLELRLFLTIFFAFLLSPVNQGGLDQRFSLLVSRAIAHDRTFDLSRYDLRLDGRLLSRTSSAIVHFKVGDEWRLIREGNRLLYNYPPGTPILTIPFEVLFESFGVSPVKGRRFDFLAEARIQRPIACFIMAAFVVVCFCMARAATESQWTALVVALGVAFGTPVWSSLTRSLWNQTWAVFLSGCVAYLVLEDAVGRRRLNPAILATLVAWVFFCRPTGAIVAVATTGYIAIERRDMLVQLILVGALWFAAFIALSLSIYGRPIPDYYLGLGNFSARQIPEALAGVWLSPSRGLFVYSPICLWVLLAGFLHWGEIPHKRLACLAIAICVAQTFAVTCDSVWWGGFCYGPRLMSDAVPWIALIAILLCRTSLGGGASALAVAILLICATMNAPGALSYSTMTWNPHHNTATQMWDLRHPQFLAWVQDDAAGPITAANTPH
jgi:hypothetical protein